MARRGSTPSGCTRSLRSWLLDWAARHGLRVMIGLPWGQHVAFLDDRRLARQTRRDAAAQVRALGSHPAALLFCLGNEIPPSVVRWHGRARVERFLRDLYDEVKAASPDSLLTYVNFPPTEYLDARCYDVCAFNVYLHGNRSCAATSRASSKSPAPKPLLLAEAGADSIREGLAGQAQITAMQLRAAFEEGLCGAVAFSWTDEWWRGGHDVDDWAFGLVDRERRPKPALAAVSQVFADAPFGAAAAGSGPRCRWWSAPTTPRRRSTTASRRSRRSPIPTSKSSSSTTARATRRARSRVVPRRSRHRHPERRAERRPEHRPREATGEIVAYTDADVRVDPDWLSYLVQPFVRPTWWRSGGPNVVPPDDPCVAQCVARSPGGPTHVLLTDRIAEHVPGCNMAFRRDALLAIGGFNPSISGRATTSMCAGGCRRKARRSASRPSALVWHHHRPPIEAYWRQQVGYGEGEAWLDAHHPEKFVGGNMIWRGRIYSPLPFVRSLSGRRINTGVWGRRPFRRCIAPTSTPSSSFRIQPLGSPFSTLALLAGALAPVVSVRERGRAAAGYGNARMGTPSDGASASGCAPIFRSSAPRRPGWAAVGYRLLIAALHLIQPLARCHGRVRGMMSPPRRRRGRTSHPIPVERRPAFAVKDSASATLLLAGGRTEAAFWGEIVDVASIRC